MPAHRLGRRAHAVGVGRLAGDKGRQRAAALDHHAQAAKTEDLDLDRGLLHHLAHLFERQHARQHGAHDAKLALVKVDGLEVGGRALHRQMQAQPRVALAGVAQQPRVGQNHGIDPQRDGLIQRLLPALGLRRLRVGVDGQVHLAAARVRVGQAAGQGRRVEVQAGEVARIGGVAQPQIDRVGTVVHGLLERGQATGRADQIHASHYTPSAGCTAGVVVPQDDRSRG